MSLFVGWMILTRLAGMGFSQEGKNYWLLKASPVRTGHLLLAKFLVACLPAIGLGLIFLIVISILQGFSVLQFLYGLIALLMRYFPEGTRLTRPSGGFILWVQLPENVNSLELYKLALQSGITLAPGHVFSATYQFSNFIRLNAAAYNYAIEQALERLGNMIKDLAKVS